MYLNEYRKRSKGGMSLGLISLDLTNIIMLGNHNPGMITQQWLKENELILEDLQQAISSLTISLFDSRRYFLIVEPVRLQLNIKEKEKETIESASEILSKYVKIFPNINYKGVGLNFIWNYEIGEKEEHIIDVSINKHADKDIKDIFPEHKINFGSIIYAEKEDYRLKLLIDPLKTNLIQYNFNYHFEINKDNAKKMVDYLNMFSSLYTKSHLVVKSLAEGGKI